MTGQPVFSATEAAPTRVYFVYARQQHGVSYDDSHLVQRLIRHFADDPSQRIQHLATPADIDPNDTSDATLQRLRETVGQADIVVFVRSKEAYAAYHRYVELTHAQEQSIPVIPVSYRAGDIKPDELRQHLDERRWSVDADTAIQQIQALQDEIEVVSWVDFQEYYEKVGNDNEKPVESVDVVFARPARDLRKIILQDIVVTYRAMLSYARRNTTSVNKLRVQIEDQLGEELWFDQSDIPAGKNFIDEIYQGIETSHNFLCVVSNAWLASEYCYLELQHALKMNKRVVPVIYEEFDREKCLAIIEDRDRNNNGWRVDLSPEQLLNQYIQPAWEEISTWEVIPTDGRIGTETVAHVLRRFDTEADYMRTHTGYLVQARAHEAGDGALLNMRQAWQARQWVRRNQQRGRLAPNDVHRTFFEASYRAIAGRVIAGVAALALVVAGFGLLLAQLEATEAQAQRDLAAEANKRLQVLSQLDSSDTYDMPGAPGTPLIAHGSIWVSTPENTVVRTQLNGLQTTTYTTGIDPGQPLAAAGAIWVSNRGEDSVTRIDPATGDTTRISALRSPRRPLAVGDDVWVYSMLSGRVMRLTGHETPGAASAVRIGLNTSRPISGGGYLWYLNGQGDTLHRVAADGDIQTVPLDERARQLVYSPSDETLYAVLSASLRPVTPQTLTLRAPLSLPQSVMTVYVHDEYLWAMTADRQQVLRIQPETASVDAIQYDNHTLQSLALTPGRVWLIATNHIGLFDAVSLARLGDTDAISDADDLLRPVSDGVHAWFVLPERSTTFLLSETTGAVVRELSPCADTPPPLFDGTRMWYSCRDSNRLLSLPADMYFFGERTTATATGSYPPIITGSIAWLTQRGTGRIHAYDMHNQTHRLTIDAGAGVLPPVYDAPYIWAVVRQTGEVLRIDTTQLQSHQTAPDSNRLVTRYEVNRPVSNVQLYGAYLWLSHMFESPDDVVVTIVDTATVEPVATSGDATVAGAGLYHNGEVWVTSYELDGGYYARVDPASAQIEKTYQFEQTTYASMVPVLYEGLLWFTPSIPQADHLMSVVADIRLDTLPEKNLPFYLVGVDPETVTEVVAHRLPVWADIPRFIGDYAWFDVVEAPDFTSEAFRDLPNLGTLVLNHRTGEVVGLYSFCERQGNGHLVADRAWVGCWQGHDEFTVADATNPEQRVTYDAVGEYPNAPLLIDNQVIFTLRDSGTVAVFDVNSGDWLANYRTGGEPTVPFTYQGTLWVYSSTADTLQRIELPAG